MKDEYRQNKSHRWRYEWIINKEPNKSSMSSSKQQVSEVLAKKRGAYDDDETTASYRPEVQTGTTKGDMLRMDEHHHERVMADCMGTLNKACMRRQTLRRQVTHNM